MNFRSETDKRLDKSSSILLISHNVCAKLNKLVHLYAHEARHGNLNKNWIWRWSCVKSIVCRKSVINDDLINKSTNLSIYFDSASFHSRFVKKKIGEYSMTSFSHVFSADRWWWHRSPRTIWMEHRYSHAVKHVKFRTGTGVGAIRPFNTT